MNEDARNEYHLKVMRIIQKNPAISQRELAAVLGISLGKTNYCIQALIEKGLVKVQNFKNSPRKVKYVYLLTPEGVSSRAYLTYKYLTRRINEYDALRQEIEVLKNDLKQLDGSDALSDGL